MTDPVAFVALALSKLGAALAIPCIRKKGSIFHQIQNAGGVVLCAVL